MINNIHEIAALTGIIVYGISFIISIYENKSRRSFTLSTIFAGISILFMVSILIYLWITYKRPPMRSIGETRLWYAFFMPSIGLLTFRLWKYRWFLSYSLLMGIVFLFINLIKPELFVKHLPPALQSPWFVPHVIVYILGYSLLGASAIISVYQIISRKTRDYKTILLSADSMVYSGFILITFGLLFGALWAKVAWGNYWSWDPKETWALITWLVYSIYIHYRLKQKKTLDHRVSMLFLIFAFLIVLLAWMGMKFIPAAQNSIHTYG